VGLEQGKNDLETILVESDVDTSLVAGVSIDIDSDDAAVFESIGFNPFFVIVEFNPYLPADASFRNPKGQNMGNSIGELLSVAQSKKMFPVGITPTNLIFLSEKFRGIFQEIQILNEIKKLNLPRFGWGYDGTLLRFSTSGIDTTQEFYHNGWSGQLLFQPAPKFLRGYQDSKLKRLLRAVLPTFGSFFSHGIIPLKDMILRGVKSRF
jgi:hypothetical protein